MSDYHQFLGLNFYCSQKIITKLRTEHHVKLEEVAECFLNREGKYLIDTREGNQTDPETRWFIAPTDTERVLKVVFVSSTPPSIKTAYEPNSTEIEIYQKYAMQG